MEQPPPAATLSNELESAARTSNICVLGSAEEGGTSNSALPPSTPTPPAPPSSSRLIRLLQKKPSLLGMFDSNTTVLNNPTSQAQAQAESSPRHVMRILPFIGKWDSSSKALPPTPEPESVHQSFFDPAVVDDLTHQPVVNPDETDGVVNPHCRKPHVLKGLQRITSFSSIYSVEELSDETFRPVSNVSTSSTESDEEPLASIANVQRLDHYRKTYNQGSLVRIRVHNMVNKRLAESAKKESRLSRHQVPDPNADTDSEHEDESVVSAGGKSADETSVSTSSSGRRPVVDIERPMCESPSPASHISSSLPEVTSLPIGSSYSTQSLGETAVPSTSSKTESDASSNRKRNRRRSHVHDNLLETYASLVAELTDMIPSDALPPRKDPRRRSGLRIDALLAQFDEMRAATRACEDEAVVDDSDSKIVSDFSGIEPPPPSASGEKRARKRPAMSLVVSSRPETVELEFKLNDLSLVASKEGTLEDSPVTAQEAEEGTTTIVEDFLFEHWVPDSCASTPLLSEPPHVLQSDFVEEPPQPIVSNMETNESQATHLISQSPVTTADSAALNCVESWNPLSAVNSTPNYLTASPSLSDDAFTTFESLSRRALATLAVEEAVQSLNRSDMSRQNLSPGNEASLLIIENPTTATGSPMTLASTTSVRGYPLYARSDSDGKSSVTGAETLASVRSGRFGTVQAIGSEYNKDPHSMPADGGSSSGSGHLVLARVTREITLDREKRPNKVRVAISLLAGEHHSSREEQYHIAAIPDAGDASVARQLPLPENDSVETRAAASVPATALNQVDVSPSSLQVGSSGKWRKLLGGLVRKPSWSSIGSGGGGGGEPTPRSSMDARCRSPVSPIGWKRGEVTPRASVDQSRGSFEYSRASMDARPPPRVKGPREWRGESPQFQTEDDSEVRVSTEMKRISPEARSGGRWRRLPAGNLSRMLDSFMGR
ncbi:hypothetical protein DFJ73DRAFT_963344 [Zopfochytrium polystomum]|nr:hypothetical protein DFJ73DRAFT_963344 [Zopfochytrium polystomum]